MLRPPTAPPQPPDFAGADEEQALLEKVPHDHIDKKHARTLQLTYASRRRNDFEFCSWSLRQVKSCWCVAGAVFLCWAYSHLAGSTLVRRQHSKGHDDVLELRAEICWQPLSSVPGMGAVDQGIELGKLKYSHITECTDACIKKPGCRSFTACGDWQQCFLKDKLLTTDQPLTHIGFSCWSYAPVQCGDGLLSNHVAEPSQSSSGDPNSGEGAGIFAPLPLLSTSPTPTPAYSPSAPDFSPQMLGSGRDLPGVRSATKRTDRSGYQWTMYTGFDLPDSAALGELRDADVETAKRMCKEEGFIGFRFCKGKALLVSFPRPLVREDLAFVGLPEDEKPIFYVLSPWREMAWLPAPSCDFPGQDAEVMDSLDLEVVKRRAENMGYPGFTVRAGKAYLKSVDQPIRRSSLKCYDVGDCTFYLAAPHEKATGVRPYIDTHLKYQGECTQSGTKDNCVPTGCCTDKEDVCFEQQAGLGVCARDCNAGATNWRHRPCKVVGKVRLEGFRLFCFSLARSGGEDFRLTDGQIKQGVGIASCDEFMVFSDKRVSLSSGSYTVPLESFEDSPKPFNKASTATHYQAWQAIFDHYIWREYDWIAKVDPQALFFPNQLKFNLMKNAGEWRAFNAHDDKGVYLRTCLSGRLWMTGALQVFSSKAAVIFSFQRGRCSSWGTLPEDLWLQSCVNSLGIHGIAMPILQDVDCGSDLVMSSNNFTYTAFHPLASLHDMQDCSANLPHCLSLSAATRSKQSAMTGNVGAEPQKRTPPSRAAMRVSSREAGHSGTKPESTAALIRSIVADNAHGHAVHQGSKTTTLRTDVFHTKSGPSEKSRRRSSSGNVTSKIIGKPSTTTTRISTKTTTHAKSSTTRHLVIRSKSLTTTTSQNAPAPSTSAKELQNNSSTKAAKDAPVQVAAGVIVGKPPVSGDQRASLSAEGSIHTPVGAVSAALSPSSESGADLAKDITTTTSMQAPSAGPQDFFSAILHTLFR